MKVVELQRRALPHFHAVIRLDGPSERGEPPSAPDTTLSAHHFAILVRQATTETALVLPGDRTLRFGEQIDIKTITTASGKDHNDSQISGRQIAGYLAKYVTKSVADFGIGVRRFSPAVIDQLDITEHVRDILRTIVTISKEEPYADILNWIHTLGYRGHVISKSRQFSTTMTALREKRTEWGKSEACPAISGSRTDELIPWQFHRLGLDSLGDRALIVSASNSARDQRIAALQARKEGA